MGRRDATCTENGSSRRHIFTRVKCSLGRRDATYGSSRRHKWVVATSQARRTPTGSSFDGRDCISMSRSAVPRSADLMGTRPRRVAPRRGRVSWGQQSFERSGKRLFGRSDGPQVLEQGLNR
jgi:hypothetical protein